MSSQSYRLHIETDHPLLGEVFQEVPPGSTDHASVDTLDKALTVLRERFVYRPVRGRTGFDKLLENLKSAEPGQRTVINCYDLSCLLASYSRTVGWSGEHALVAFCDRRLSETMARVDFHACCLLRIGGDPYWVEPERLELRRWTSEEILEQYKIRLAFNDQHIYFSEDEKRRAIMADIPAIGQQVFLYGRGHNDVQAIYDDPNFHKWIAHYFATGQFDTQNEPLIERMLASGLVERGEDSELRAGGQLVLVPRQAELELRAHIAPAIDSYLGVVAKTVPVLRRVFEASDTAQHFQWSQVCHAIVAGMFMDLSVGARLDLAADVRDRFGETVVWGFENVSALNGFGVQWHTGTHPARGVTQLWHRTVERRTMGLDRKMAQSMIDLAMGRTEISNSPEWLFLKFHKLIQSGQIVPPVFSPETTDALLDPLMKGGEELVNEAFLPSFELAAKHHWWQRIESDHRFRHAIVRLVLEYATDRVISAGLLVPFPEGQVDPTWGRWIWLERDDSPGRLVPPSLETEKAA